MEAPVSYYSTHKQYFSDYYKQYHLDNRQLMIDRATAHNIAHPDAHAIACRKYLNANKTKIYQKRNAKNRMKIVLRELVDHFKFC